MTSGASTNVSAEPPVVLAVARTRGARFTIAGTVAFAILLLAGLQGIPREIEEAALIDGAGRWQAFRYVTLPLIGPTLRVSIFLSVIGALQLFDLVWVTTAGGPLNASTTMAVNMFKTGFVKQQMGYGSALAVLLFLCALVVALLYQRFVLRRDIDGAVTAYNG